MGGCGGIHLGGYFGVNFGHLKSEVFHLWGEGGGGAFWSEIPERGFVENLDKKLLFSQKPACASQIVSHILRMRRLIRHQSFMPLYTLKITPQTKKPLYRCVHLKIKLSNLTALL